MKKTDIYGTIGPACGNQETLTEMFRLGMTGMRLNLSHTELEECREWTNLMKESAHSAGKQSKLLIDLKGPELRIGSLNAPIQLSEEGNVYLKREKENFSSFGRNVHAAEEKESILLSKRENICLREESIPLPAEIFTHLEKAQEVLLDDGKIQLEITEITEEKALCRVIRGGTLNSRKSIALPGISLQLPVLTESDRRNIRKAKEHGVSGVMLPFVRSGGDLKLLRQELVQNHAEELQIFAKIENMEGVKNLEDILPYADQIVIARGDLGNSMPLWELPAVQAEIAEKCKKAEKPFMVVTQMLASMERCAVPTRAEVSDIFRAVAEGAASVMVTGETALGNYPEQVIRYLVNTVKSAEDYLIHSIKNNG
ncbi:MAG: pyruvate kinase [Lachnospiraceae bacterium]|nr:pyruvate kinase [Lachnospiraceae bacterium]